MIMHEHLGLSKAAPERANTDPDEDFVMRKNAAGLFDRWTAENPIVWKYTLKVSIVVAYYGFAIAFFCPVENWSVRLECQSLMNCVFITCS